jgi:hypothetical protein
LLGPGFGLRGGFGPMMGPRHHVEMRGLSAAADYLDLKESELLTKLQNGKSLADIAKDQGKSVDGLIQALIDDAKKHLDQAVADGKLTKAQADQFLSRIKEHITALVNGTAPPGFGPQFRDRPGFPGPGGPPAFRGGSTGPGWGSSA